MEQKKSFTKTKERATRAGNCWHVSVSVHRYSTVYSTKDTTWSGSPLWKKEQQEVRQHWFIQWYIAAYIQGLYKGDTIHPTGLTVNQGCSQVSTVSLIQRCHLFRVSFSPWCQKIRAVCFHPPPPHRAIQFRAYQCLSYSCMLMNVRHGEPVKLGRYCGMIPRNAGNSAHPTKL